MSTRKHIAKKGVNAGRWVNCTAANCRNEGQHISSDTLYAAQQWYKQNDQKVNLKDFTEDQVDVFIAANPDPTLWSKPKMVDFGVGAAAPAPEVVVAKIEDKGTQSFMKSVFNRLFRKTPPTPVPVKVEKPSPANTTTIKLAPTETEQAGALSRDSKGRLGILSNDTLSENLSRYPIGNLTDETTAKQLHDADPYKNYQNGDCGVLANEIWNLSPHADKYYVFKTEEEPIEGIHQLVQLKDGTYVDSLGVWTEEEITSYWATIYPDAKFEEWDDGEETPERDKTTPVSNERLFNVLSSAINSRFQH